MAGKGDKARPLSVDQKTYDENWDRIFGKKTFEPNYENMWQHSCTVELGVMWIGKNETCNYCGAWEEDEL